MKNGITREDSPSSFDFQSAVPWGRSLDEYAAMFDLSPADLGRRFVDCGAGPSSFNLELTAAGGSVVSCDPLYAHPAFEIAARIAETFAPMIRSVEAEQDRFVWTRFRSPSHLGEERMTVMNAFLADYDEPANRNRYVNASLPNLPFDAGAFDIALCSHFLFLYSHRLSARFHVESILEMLRVAGQVRIFPMLDMRRRPSEHVDGVTQSLIDRGIDVTVRQVNYEFQKAGNRAMVLRASR